MARHLDGLCALVLGLLVLLVADRSEIGQQVERNGPAAAYARRPDHDVGARTIGVPFGRVLLAPQGGKRRPDVAEPREIVVGIEHDRRNSEQCRLLDNAAQEHGLARAGACQNGDMARQ